MLVEIHHQKFNELTRQMEGYQHVATIDITPDTCSENWKLNEAWRWTNNIDGSWSRGEMIEEFDTWKNRPTGRLVENPDYNPNTTVHVTLDKWNGVEVGLRSSMIGDRFVIAGKTFEVANTGFELVHYEGEEEENG